MRNAAYIQSSGVNNGVVLRISGMVMGFSSMIVGIIAGALTFHPDTSSGKKSRLAGKGQCRDAVVCPLLPEGSYAGTPDPLLKYHFSTLLFSYLQSTHSS